MQRFFMLPIFAVAAWAQTPDAAEIMRRVSENLDRANEVRARYVYDQDIFIRLQRANAKLAREENRQYTVAPTEKGAMRKLVSVKGTIRKGSTSINYFEAGFRQKETDIDGALVDSFAREVMWRHSAIPNMQWFPFERKDLDQYSFQFEGEERYKDYDVYKISFRMGVPGDQWEGEALIERDEYQPVLVTTAWTGHIPALARITLGTNIRHVGARIAFQRFDKDTWFPISSGGEMKVRVLFLYSRTIAFSSTNSGFRKTDVQSSVEFDR